jgi:hypothetical protein
MTRVAGIGRFGFGIGLWLAVAGSAFAQMGPPRPGPRCLPGAYDGSQPEIAATLDLGDDHRFRYGLSYGALDEAAVGRWESDGAAVLLTSDPVTPPGFTLLREDVAARGELRLRLDLPGGLSHQYFSAIVRFADGRSTVRQFQNAELAVDLAPEERPVSVTLLLSALDLESEAFAVEGGGRELHLRFDPNDLGKVAFDHTPLRFDREDLLLERHDRLIRFRRSDAAC